MEGRPEAGSWRAQQVTRKGDKKKCQGSVPAWTFWVWAVLTGVETTEANFLFALHQDQNLPFLLPVYVRDRNGNFRASLAYHRRWGKSIQETEPVTSTLLLL